MRVPSLNYDGRLVRGGKRARYSAALARPNAVQDHAPAPAPALGSRLIPSIMARDHARMQDLGRYSDIFVYSNTRKRVLEFFFSIWYSMAEHGLCNYLPNDILGLGIAQSAHRGSTLRYRADTRFRVTVSAVITVYT
jgi:hypothetical protein